MDDPEFLPFSGTSPKRCLGKLLCLGKRTARPLCSYRVSQDHTGAASASTHWPCVGCPQGTACRCSLYMPCLQQNCVIQHKNNKVVTRRFTHAQKCIAAVEITSIRGQLFCTCLLHFKHCLDFCCTISSRVLST